MQQKRKTGRPRKTATSLIKGERVGVDVFINQSNLCQYLPAVSVGQVMAKLAVLLPGITEKTEPIPVRNALIDFFRDDLGAQITLVFRDDGYELLAKVSGMQIAKAIVKVTKGA